VGLALQVLVNLRDGHRPLSDGRRHPFHRARAYVTGRETRRAPSGGSSRTWIWKPPGSPKDSN